MRKLTNNEWVSEMMQLHGDGYSYEKCHYDGSHSKVTITCKKHGDFITEAGQFAKGYGCPLCRKEEREQSTIKNFLSEARKVHGDKYTYRFDQGKNRVTVICPEHGEFVQNRYSHLSGCGCKECYRERRKNKNKDQKLLTERWIKKARSVHGDKYDYSKSVYKSAKEKILIICPEHGEFLQTASEHTGGKGCPKCGIERNRQRFIFDKEKMIEAARKVHGDKYEYVGEYHGMRKNMVMKCPIHGEFSMLPTNHIHGKKGCPECGKIKCRESNTMTTEQFIERCKAAHGDKYDYSNTVYNGWNNEFEYVCHKKYANGDEHGVIRQKPSVHLLMDCGCPKCGRTVSKAEHEIADYVRQYADIVQNTRSVLPSHKELDIYVPSLKLGIEYNGMAWHSEAHGKGRHYHLDKLNECNENGIKLINILEYEYLKMPEIVKSKLSHILHADCGKKRIYGRKCHVREIDKDDAKKFLDRNHIQGSCGSTLSLGCMTNEGNILVGVMSFKKRSSNSDEWELVRFATDMDYICPGVGGKLFSHFINNYEYSSIISFADRRWTTDDSDNLYTKLGFALEDRLQPDYRYTKTAEDYIHKFSFRKKALNRKYGLPLSMTEKEMADELGYTRIWNCGLLKYVFRKKSSTFVENSVKMDRIKELKKSLEGFYGMLPNGKDWLIEKGLLNQEEYDELLLAISKLNNKMENVFYTNCQG